MSESSTALRSEGLYEVGQRPQFGAYLREAWRRRSFAFSLAAYRLVGSLLQNRLGLLWIVLRPLAMAVIYGSIFHFVLSGAARPADYVQFLIVGIFVFEFFAGCFGNGARAVTSNSKLVQSLGFPRILLPTSVVIEQAMRMVPVVALLYILLIVFREPISWTWLLLIPVLAMMAVFNLGVALIVARLAAWVRDVHQIVPIVQRVLFYASGILFNIDGAFANAPVLLTIAHLLPTYGFIAIARDVTLQAHDAPLLTLIATPVWTVVVIVLGVIFFWQAESKYGLND